MKKVSVLAATMILLFGAVSTSASSNPSTNFSTTSVMATPPAAVLSAFTTLFGNVPVRQWKLRKDGNWRAHFMNNGVAWEATFTPSGILVKSERD